MTDALTAWRHALKAVTQALGAARAAEAAEESPTRNRLIAPIPYRPGPARSLAATLETVEAAQNRLIAPIPYRPGPAPSLAPGGAPEVEASHGGHSGPTTALPGMAGLELALERAGRER